MDKKFFSLVCLILSIFIPGCTKNNHSEEKPYYEDPNYVMQDQANETTFYASDIYDDSGINARKIYKFKANVSDKYYLNCNPALELKLYDGNGNLIHDHCLNTSVQLIKDRNYFLEVLTQNPNQEFKLECYPIYNTRVTPYPIQKENIEYNLKDSKKDPLQPAKLNYTKREGGTYLYSNVPESMPQEVVNTILMQNKDLSNECFLTFEHQNKTNTQQLYLGYRLKNTQEKDLYITIMNVGYQTKGSWLGEKSWMDYYGVQFDIDPSQFINDPELAWFDAYLGFDLNYQPKAFHPITYKLPKGEQIYIIGGTTYDAYHHINVRQTADIYVNQGACVNGNVRFNITNGVAVGELCVYDNINKINQENVKIQNLRRYGENDDFGGRIGYSPIHGVIDNHAFWEFNDLTTSQNLPVTYESYYADTLKASYEPFEPVTGCYNHVKSGTYWETHLSAQVHRDINLIGSDMVDLYAICDGKEVILSNYIANPTGQIWDFGNWMIEYQDVFTFVNNGNQTRKVQCYVLSDYGSIFYNVKSLEDELYYSSATAIRCTGRVPLVEYTIAAHSVESVVLQYVLPANTSGGVIHYVTLI